MGWGDRVGRAAALVGAGACVRSGGTVIVVSMAPALSVPRFRQPHPHVPRELKPGQLGLLSASLLEAAWMT